MQNRKTAEAIKLSPKEAAAKLAGRLAGQIVAAEKAPRATDQVVGGWAIKPSGKYAENLAAAVTLPGGIVLMPVLVGEALSPSANVRDPRYRQGSLVSYDALAVIGSGNPDVLAFVAKHRGGPVAQEAKATRKGRK